MKENTEINDILDEDSPVERTEGGMVLLPKEMETAPEEVKTFYIKWLEISKVMKEDRSRYFEFMNQESKEMEMVDTMQFEGKAILMAKAKHISDNDMVRLKETCKRMQAYKSQKTRYCMGYTRWLRPRMGRDVFDWRKAEIIDLFAKYATQEEVKKTLEGWGYTVNMNHILKFFLNNKDTIDKKRIEFLRTSKDHYLATDAGRMETLAMLHIKFVKLFNDTYTTVSTSPSTSKAELRSLSQEIRAIIEQARKEVKGDEIKLTIDGKIDINATLQASLTIQEISRKVPINIIPIYMVAVKQGIDPHSIIASLVNSYYKDFNGFTKLNNVNDPPNTMDLIRNYDWNEIANYQANKPKDQTMSLAEYEEVPFTDISKIQTKREKLLELINKQIKEGEKE